MYHTYIYIYIRCRFIYLYMEYKEHVIVATPGKILQALKGKYIDVSNICVFVLDEADEMIENDNFKKICKTVKKYIEKSKNNSKEFQKLLFSATFSVDVRKFVLDMVDEKANIIMVKTKELLLDKIKQFKIYCNNEYVHKLSILEG